MNVYLLVFVHMYTYTDKYVIAHINFNNTDFIVFDINTTKIKWYLAVKNDNTFYNLFLKCETKTENRKIVQCLFAALRSLILYFKHDQPFLYILIKILFAFSPPSFFVHPYFFSFISPTIPQK